MPHSVATHLPLKVRTIITTSQYTINLKIISLITTKKKQNFPKARLLLTSSLRHICWSLWNATKRMQSKTPIVCTSGVNEWPTGSPVCDTGVPLHGSSKDSDKQTLCKRAICITNLTRKCLCYSHMHPALPKDTPTSRHAAATCHDGVCVILPCGIAIRRLLNHD